MRHEDVVSYDTFMTFWVPHFDAIIVAKDAVDDMEATLADFQARFEVFVHGERYEGRKLEEFVVSHTKREAYHAAKQRAVEWPRPFIQPVYADELYGEPIR